MKAEVAPGKKSQQEKVAEHDLCSRVSCCIGDQSKLEWLGWEKAPCHAQETGHTA